MKSSGRSFRKKDWSRVQDKQQEEPDRWGTSKVAKPNIVFKDLVNVPPKVNGFQNFLRNFMFQESNLKPDEQGIVKLNFDTSMYTTVIIQAVDRSSMTQWIVYLDEVTTEEIVTWDLSLSTPLDVSKAFTEQKSC